jgi:hypothetical protein
MNRGTNKNKAEHFQKYKEKWGLRDYHFHISNQTRFGWKDVILLTHNNHIKYYLYSKNEMMNNEIRTVSSLIKRKDIHFAIQHPKVDNDMLAGTDWTIFDNLEELLEYSLVRKISGI